MYTCTMYLHMPRYKDSLAPYLLHIRVDIMKLRDFSSFTKNKITFLFCFDKNKIGYKIDRITSSKRKRKKRKKM